MTGIADFRFQRDPRDGSPLYLQVAAAIERRLRSSGQGGGALPPERVLATSLDVSRVTMRKAIDQLVAKGLIVRRHGSGNYVAPHLVQGLSRLSGFSEELRERGLQPSSTWLSRELTHAEPTEAAALGLQTGAPIARLERLRRADGVVMAFERTALPQSVLPAPSRVTHSLYAHLARRGHAPVRALQRMRAVNADAGMAARLEVRAGTALLYVVRVAYGATGLAVEMTESYCRGDYYDFVIELRRDR